MKNKAFKSGLDFHSELSTITLWSLEWDILTELQKGYESVPKLSSNVNKEKLVIDPEAPYPLWYSIFDKYEAVSAFLFGIIDLQWSLYTPSLEEESGHFSLEDGLDPVFSFHAE